MFDYWLLLTLTLGIIGLFVIVNKNINKEKDIEEINVKKDILRIKNVNIEEIEKKFVLTLEKILKRLRVLVLRTDNGLSKSLKKIRSQKNEKDIFSISKLTSYEVISDSDKETTRVLEINYLESVKSNPNVDNYLKLAELYMNCKDFNSCHALLYKAWELDKSNERLLKMMKDLRDIETKNTM